MNHPPPPVHASPVLREHPDLELDDTSEALHYAALAVQERERPLRLPA
jgi:hypothetical protein